MQETTSHINFTRNDTTTRHYSTITEDDSDLKMITIGLCTLTLLLGVCGNTLVITISLLNWSKLKLYEILMVNLAVCDLISTVLLSTIKLLEHMEFDFAIVGDFGCQIWYFILQTTVTASALTLLLISVDRFIVVKWPMQRILNRQKIARSIALTWFTSSLLYISYFLNRIKLFPTSKGLSNCSNNMRGQELRIHSILVYILQFAIPFFTMCVLYIMITIELRSAVKKPILITKHGIRDRIKQNRKTTFLFIILLTVFYICVFPEQTFFLLVIFKLVKYHSGRHLRLVYTIMQMLSMLNNCVNPLVYGNLHQRFRKVLEKVWCWICCCRRQGDRNVLSMSNDNIL